MKAFHFSLESVLVLRQRQEKVAMGNYAKSLEAHRQALLQLEAAESELNAGWNDMRRQISTGCSAAQAIQSRRFVESLEAQRQKRITETNVAAHRRNAAMQAMLLAKQQREVVDKFFEREKKRYAYACSRAEQKLLDDLLVRDASPLSWHPGKNIE